MIGKFCLQCGEEIPRDSIYCPKCGAEFEKTGQVKAGLPKEETGTYEKKSPSAKINQKTILGIFGIIALVAIAAFALSSFSPETLIQDNETQNSGGVDTTLSAMDYYNEGISLYDQ